MNDKFLSTGEWKKFSKGRNLRDAGFVKALDELARTDAAGEQQKLLITLRKEVEPLRKSAKGDKEFLA